MAWSSFDTLCVHPYPPCYASPALINFASHYAMRVMSRNGSQVGSRLAEIATSRHELSEDIGCLVLIHGSYCRQ